MNRIFAILCGALLVAAAACGKTAPEPAEAPAAATPDPAVVAEKVAPFEKVLDAALAAYNDGDAAAFVATLAKDAHPPATEKTFHAVFDGIYRVEFGKFVSKQLVPTETIPDANYGQVVYNGTFEKRARVKVSADFIREGGDLKIVQLRFEKM